MSIENTLNRNIGTSKYYTWKLPFGNVIVGYYTDGINEMAELCKAHWLIDVVMSNQTSKFKSKHPFQVWIIKQDKQGAVVIAEDGNGNKIKTQGIHFTTFPFEEFSKPFKMFFCNDVLHLPSEY